MWKLSFYKSCLAVLLAKKIRIFTAMALVTFFAYWNYLWINVFLEIIRIFKGPKRRKSCIFCLVVLLQRLNFILYQLSVVRGLAAYFSGIFLKPIFKSSLHHLSVFLVFFYFKAIINQIHFACMKLIKLGVIKIICRTILWGDRY